MAILLFYWLRSTLSSIFFKNSGEICVDLSAVLFEYNTFGNSVVETKMNLRYNNTNYENVLRKAAFYAEQETR